MPEIALQEKQEEIAIPNTTPTPPQEKQKNVGTHQSKFNEKKWVADSFDTTNSGGKEVKVVDYRSYSHCNGTNMRRIRQNCTCNSCVGKTKPVVILAAECRECKRIKIVSPLDARTPMPPVLSLKEKSFEPTPPAPSLKKKSSELVILKK